TAVNTGLSAKGADDNLIKCVSSSISAGVAGAKLGPGLVLVFREKDPDARATLIQKLIGGVADAVAHSLTAVSSSIRAKAEKLEGTEQTKLLEQAAAFGKIASVCCRHQTGGTDPGNCSGHSDGELQRTGNAS